MAKGIFFKDLGKVKLAVESYAKDKTIVEKGNETAYHVIQANHTMNPEYQVLSDDNYMIAAQSYVRQLEVYWEDENEKRPENRRIEFAILHTAQVIR